MALVDALQTDGSGLTEAAIQDLKSHLRGPLIAPGDPEYAAARQVYNGMIDRYPRLIARCTDVADVITAVNFGRETGLTVAVRGGGHNGGGLGIVDDGLVIDLSLLKGVRSIQWHAPHWSPVAQHSATSTMRRTRSGWLHPSASSRRPALPA